MRILRIFIIILLCICSSEVYAQRRMNPVNNQSTETQPRNETRNDTARINAKRRAQSIIFTNDKGQAVYLDTVSNEEWIDSTAIIDNAKKMKIPLWDGVSVGVNLWDPIMKLTGQDYGVTDFWVEMSFHNRYKPVVNIGLGQATHRGPSNNYIYRSPLSVFFRVGMDYNFLFNSNPDYSLSAGVRYGFSPFSFSVDDVTYDNTYWGTTTEFAIPSQKVNAGWLEFVLGVRVKLYGPISAGWQFRYRSILHESVCAHGEPYYIPGFGARSGAISGSFSVSYKFSLAGLNKPQTTDVGIVLEEELPENKTVNNDTEE